MEQVNAKGPLAEFGKIYRSELFKRGAEGFKQEMSMHLAVFYI